VLEARPGEGVCVPALHLPAGTAFVRLQVYSPAAQRPALHVSLRVAGREDDRLDARAGGGRPRTRDECRLRDPAERRAAGVARRAPLSDRRRPRARRRNAALQAGRQRADARRHARRGRASRSGICRAPGGAAATSRARAASSTVRRCFAPAPSARGHTRCCCSSCSRRSRCSRCAAWRWRSPGAGGGWPRGLFAIAAINACCWALITPVFQGPDEVDHFAYTQALVERGQKPTDDPRAPVLRWSSAENLALETTSFLTDHQVGDTRAPWLTAQVREYERRRGSRADEHDRRRRLHDLGRARADLLPRARARVRRRERRLDLLAADADAVHLGADRRARRAVHVSARTRARAAPPVARRARGAARRLRADVRLHLGDRQ